MGKPMLTEEQKKRLTDQTKTLLLTRSVTLTEGQTTLVIDGIKKEFDLEQDFDAYVILAYISQQGGTARGCSGNFEISYLNQPFKLSRIRNVFKETIKDRFGLRKFARTHASFFQEICHNSKKLPGNLTNRIAALNEKLTLTSDQKVWLSDYQADNDKAPQELRALIKQYFTIKTTKNPKNK